MIVCELVRDEELVSDMDGEYETDHVVENDTETVTEAECEDVPVLSLDKEGDGDLLIAV